MSKRCTPRIVGHAGKAAIQIVDSSHGSPYYSSGLETAQCAARVAAATAALLGPLAARLRGRCTAVIVCGTNIDAVAQALFA